ncbi:hypothetical protein ACOMHN_050025 [Nucella lapillus]
MWWPSTTDHTCTEVTEEQKGRTSPSLKRHRAMSLEELLAFELFFKETENKNEFGNDGATKTSSTVQTDVIVDADVIMGTDVTAYVHNEVIRTEELRKSSMFDLLNIYCST